MRYFSQFGEDQWLFEHGHIKENGFYLDVGAGDPERFSNTAMLNLIGWKGVCFDVNEKQIAKLNKARSWVEHLAVGLKQECSFSENEYPDLTRQDSKNLDGVINSFKVPGVRLDTFCATHEIEHIDFLSIDTEGTELEVLISLGSRLLPEIIVVEFNTLYLRKNDVVLEKYLDTLGYSLLIKTEANLVYKLLS